MSGADALTAVVLADPDSDGPRLPCADRTTITYTGRDR
jgi:hypothetical protein